MVETTQTTDAMTTFATLDEDKSNKEFIYIDKLVLYSGGYDSTMLLHKVANDKSIKNYHVLYIQDDSMNEKSNICEYFAVHQGFERITGYKSTNENYNTPCLFEVQIPNLISLNHNNYNCRQWVPQLYLLFAFIREKALKNHIIYKEIDFGYIQEDIAGKQATMKNIWETYINGGTYDLGDTKYGDKLIRDEIYLNNHLRFPLSEEKISKEDAINYLKENDSLDLYCWTCATPEYHSTTEIIGKTGGTININEIEDFVTCGKCHKCKESLILDQEKNGKIKYVLHDRKYPMITNIPLANKNVLGSH